MESILDQMAKLDAELKAGVPYARQVEISLEMQRLRGVGPGVGFGGLPIRPEDTSTRKT